MRCRCVVRGEYTHHVGWTCAHCKPGLEFTLCLRAKGILLWFMLTGVLPFDQSSPQEMMERRKVLQTSVLEEDTWMHISGACCMCLVAYRNRPPRKSDS